MKTITVPSQRGALDAALSEARASGVRNCLLRLEPGYHFLSDTLRIDASEWDALAIEGAMSKGGRAVIGSGRSIQDWRETKINGLAAWAAYVPSGWSFRQLFVGGKRQRRACWPKYSRDNPPDKRLTAVAHQDTSSPLFPPHDDPANRFKLDEEDMQRGLRLIGSEVVCLHHWLDERHPIVAIDDAGWLVSSRYGVCAKHEHGKYARYYIDNLREALTEPGEWYLDCRESQVYYIPEEGQNPNDLEIIAPSLTHLIKIEGDAQSKCQSIQFRNMTFAHSEWQMARGGRQLEIHRQQSEIFRNLHAENGYAGFCQAAAQSPAAIEMLHADRVEFSDCGFEHLGGYALFVGEGCHHHVVENCHFRDLGAGGIQFSGDLDPSNYCSNDCCPEDAQDNPLLKVENTQRTNGNHRVESSHFEDGGHVFHSGIPLLLRHSSHNTIRGNEIHDFYYSGISCGWVWHFGEQPTHHNLIEDNHIYSLGHRWLSDMGGIYILGQQPGTIVRGNRVHGLTAQTYGAWGIYLDFSSSDVLVEKNLCYGPCQEPFVIHFGKRNEVRQNIFAFGSGGAFQLGKGEEGVEVAHFHHNLILVNDQPVYRGGYKMDWVQFSACIRAEQNLIWNYGSEPLKIDNLGARNLVDANPDEDDGEGNQWMVEAEEAEGAIDWLDIEQWQALGLDVDSVIADPKMVDPFEGDFRLGSDSPADALRSFNPFL